MNVRYIYILELFLETLHFTRKNKFFIMKEVFYEKILKTDKNLPIILDV